MRPVGRRRTKNLDLPPRMRRVGHAYYFDLGGKPRKWIALGSDKAKALIRWAELRGADGADHTVGTLIDKFLAQCEVKDSTLSHYRRYARIIRKYFGKAPVALVRPGHIQEFHDGYRRKMDGRNIVLLFRAMLNRAVLWEWIPVNPADKVQVRPQNRRKRYLTDSEVIAIRANLAPQFLIAAELADLLALRVSDVVRLKFSDFRDGEVTIIQKKTGDPVIYRVTLEVEALLERARQLKRPVRSFHVICSERGQPYREQTVSGAFRQAAQAAGIVDVRFHDIRAKSASDEQGTAKDRLGHRSEASTRSYIRKPVAVTPIRRRVGTE